MPQTEKKLSKLEQQQALGGPNISRQLNTRGAWAEKETGADRNLKKENAALRSENASLVAEVKRLKRELASRAVVVTQGDGGHVPSRAVDRVDNVPGDRVDNVPSDGGHVPGGQVDTVDKRRALEREKKRRYRERLKEAQP